MALYTFLGGNLSDKGRYRLNGVEPPTLPGPADDVSSLGGTATSGSISVNALVDFLHLSIGTVTATKANGVQVGNVNNVGGSATMTVTGTVDFATVYENGTLTAETIGNVLQGRGGTIALTKDYNVGTGIAGGNNTFDLDLEGGKLDISGALNLVGAQTEVSVADGAILNANSLTFGSGKNIIGAGGKNSVINISGSSSIKVDPGDSFGAGDEGVINAASVDVTVAGTSTLARASIGVGTKGKATVNNVDIKTFGALNVGVFGVAEAEFTAQAIKSIGTIAVDGSTLKAKSITFGDADGTADFYGKWTYTGNSGLFPIRSGGFVSIEKTLELKNQDDRGILLDPNVSSGFGGSMHVGGTTKVGTGELLVDGSGEIIGHGKIETTKTTVNGNGFIEALKGTIVLDGDVSGSGKLKIGDKSVIHIIDKADIDVVFMDRKDTSLAHDSVLKLDRPGDFLGEVSGLVKGTTIEISRTHLPEWTNLKNPQIAHTEINGGKLEILFTDINNLALAPQTVTIDIAGDTSGKVFSTRDILPDQNMIDFSFHDASKQIKTGVSGKLSASELGITSDYVDTLVSGWAAWDMTAGPIKYFFANTAHVKDAISLHGEILPIRPGDEKGGVLDTWSTTEMNAFKDIVKIYESVSGLKFQETKVLSEANMVWWQTIPLSRTLNKLGYSDNLALHPEGVVWQVFGVNPATGFQYLDMGGLGRNTAIHEIGHTLGLAHPFDGGPQPDRQTFPGVPQNDSSNQGLFNQNQSVYTVMSYNEGLNLNTTGKEKFGDQGGLGAFDIAAIQALYGKNTEHNKTNTVYDLKTTNGIGTGWSAIWDAGGIDTIINKSTSVGAIIDLRAATLVSGANAGGYISRATNIEGGYTIAYGVVIENATGGSVSDTLFGNDADNILDGRGGADVMGGGLGNDTYYVDTTSDTVVEFKDEGIDTVITTQTLFKLPDNVEILKVLGTTSSNLTGNADPNTLTGGAGNDILDGGGGADILTGGLGNDTYIVDDPGDQVIELDGQGSDTVISSLVLGLPNFVENFTYTGAADVSLVGTAGANALTGGTGNDTLDGGIDALADQLKGGKGDDTYIVRTAADVVTELANEGTDTVRSFITYTLGLNLENLELQDGAVINGTGNTANNKLTGNSSSNVLNGMAGADEMKGGDGSDTYVVDNIGDTVSEVTADLLIGGDDLVNSSVSFTLGPNLERLVLTGALAINGTGNALANTITGNSAANVIEGGDGNDILIGGAGIDTLSYAGSALGVDVTLKDGTLAAIVSGGDAAGDVATGFENLTGSSQNDKLTGNALANIIDGRGGADEMAGLLGNDIYVVDNDLDIVNEALNQGTDKVQSFRSFDLSTRGANVENLDLLGTDDIDGKGNAFANVIIGNSGANILDGGVDALADQLKGGKGDDTYIVRIADAVTELANEGTDTVRSHITYTLGLNLENLELVEGSAAINGTGNTANNKLTGNSSANVLNGMTGADILDGGAGTDTLIGGLGNDTLTGGSEADVFLFNTAISPVANVDTITDFATGIDKIRLENAVFTKLATVGALNPDFFVSGADAVPLDANDYLIYDTTTGILTYDSNGSTVGGAAQIAFLEGAPVLTVADFHII